MATRWQRLVKTYVKRYGGGKVGFKKAIKAAKKAYKGGRIKRVRRRIR